MQFRTVKNRVQCHAAWYDPATKRGRQKLVYSLPTFGPINKKPTPADLTPADFGTAEQREKWTSEIAAEIDRINAEAEKHHRDLVPTRFTSAAKRLAENLDQITDEQRAECVAAIVEAAGLLGLLIYDQKDVKKPRARRPAAAATPGEDPRAFGGELVDRAKALRAEGLSIAATAEKMAAEGHNVSKSWVQKWTA